MIVRLHKSVTLVSRAALNTGAARAARQYRIRGCIPSASSPRPWLAPLALAAQTSFTLDQVMSAPFPSAPVVSSTGGKIAWVYNARGVRNIWVAEPPAYRGHSVTAYTEDDGQEIAELRWTPGRPRNRLRARRRRQRRGRVSESDQRSQGRGATSLGGARPRRRASPDWRRQPAGRFAERRTRGFRPQRTGLVGAARWQGASPSN